MIKICVLGGRAEDGTVLPKKESLVWKEVQRVLEESIQDLSPFISKSELCFPLYSKFDIEFLRLTKRFNRPTTFYVPSQDWGLSRLPAHQTNLIKRVNAERIIVPNNQRIQKMIEDADIIYLMKNTNSIDNYYQYMKDKKIISFPETKMRFKTEEEGEAFFNDSVKKEVQFTKEERNKLLEMYFAQ